MSLKLHYARVFGTAKIVDKFLQQVGSDEFLEHLMTVLALYSGGASVDAAVAAFRENPAAVNHARRAIDSLYNRVRIQHVKGAILDEDVRMIMEPGSVAVFLDKIHPLSEAKAGASTTVQAQREFWERFRN